MDNGGLPLSSPLPLCQPAVQAPIENPDATTPSETAGADVVVRESVSLLAGSAHFLRNTQSNTPLRTQHAAIEHPLAAISRL